MTDAQTAITKVREALSAGPTPGKWTVDIHGDQVHVIDMDITAIARVMAQRVAGLFNAAFIAACSPANIAAIIAHVEAQAAEIKRLRKLAMSTHLFEEAPCFLCGYNGPGYYQPEQHPCAALYHEAMEEQR